MSCNSYFLKNSLAFLGCKDDSKEVDKPALSKDTAAAASAVSASTSAEMAENSNTNQSAVSEGLDDSASASGNGSSHSSSHGTRLTRSRANQGTPGPNDQGNDSPRKFKS